MIHSLRKRFLTITMLSLAATLLLIGAALNLGNFIRSTARADDAIEVLYENNGEFPDYIRPEPGEGRRPGRGLSLNFEYREETAFETRYCIVRLDSSLEAVDVDMEHIAALSSSDVVGIARRIADGQADRGYFSYYRFHRHESDGTVTVLLLDCYLQLQSVLSVFCLTVLVFVSCLVLMFFLLLYFSNHVIRPFAQNMARQKRFITDVSHELKTPLGIISANMGVLEVVKGSDEWITSTKNQVVRLNTLIAELIELSKAEESASPEQITEVNLSRTAETAAESFRTLAGTKEKQLECRIAPQVTLKGQADQLQRIIEVLLDNAIKYCDPGGTIVLSLTARRRQITLKVSNPCADMDTAKLPYLFDRFYRADDSRAHVQGSYGIGLSIAQTIAVRHRGKITAGYEDGIVTFTVLLPR